MRLGALTVWEHLGNQMLCVLLWHHRSSLMWRWALYLIWDGRAWKLFLWPRRYGWLVLGPLRLEWQPYMAVPTDFISEGDP